MKALYQLNYSSLRPHMYDKKSRISKARRILYTLREYWGQQNLGNFVVLDIGASSGIIDNYLANHFKKVIGIDLDQTAIKFAKKYFKKGNLFFRTEDAMKLSFGKETFDIVICTHVYEHVPNQNVLFKEIYRVLKRNGICYLAAQNSLWPIEAHYDLPFLSYLPKQIANIYIKASGKASTYYENPKNYWQLKNLVSDFLVTDITPKILRNPKKFGYEDKIHGGLKPLAFFLSPFSKYLSPTFFWILKK